MQNQWKKNARSNQMKAFTIAVLIHAIFFVALVAYSGSASEGGLFDWVKDKMSNEQTEKVASTDQNRS